jgi:vacuolar iron transporter family protein
MSTGQAIARYRRNFRDEIDSAAQYRAMAEGELDDRTAETYRALAAIEEKHASFWEDRLRRLNAPVPQRAPSWRARVLSFVARRFGATAVLPTIATREYEARDGYRAQEETQGTGMVAQEWSHARVLRSVLLARTSGAPGGEVARVEGRHRRVGGNALRAAVLGANDGLCSNLALLMGVAGAVQNGRAVLLAGTAGLVAGAFSMAFGEWISVTSSHELAEREIGVEREELEHEPEEEREELEIIYQARGVGREEARELAQRLVQDPKNALDVLAREELGLDPTELGGSAGTAATTSWLLFVLGAAFPLVPFVTAGGYVALVASVSVSAAVLFVLGAAISVFTGRSALWSGTRQLVIGLAAAALTYAIGRAVGVAVG